MRLMFTGAAPWCNTGYSKPLRQLFPRLTAMGHEIGLCAFFGYQGPPKRMILNDAEFTIYGQMADKFFNDAIGLHYVDWDADALITLQDVWVLDGWGQRVERWFPWLPVDTDPVSQAVLKSIRGCEAPLAWTRWSTEQLREHGHPETVYLPLAVDTKLYRPRDKAEARHQTGLPQDAFIVGMVAANASKPSRKSFPEVFCAWEQWRDCNDRMLYLHTSISPKRLSGITLDNVLNTMGLPWATIDEPDQDMRDASDIWFARQYGIWSDRYTDTELMWLYNSFDVLLAPSMSEGFGIPIVEAQACGVPVITQDTTAMTELTCAGWCLEPAAPYWEPQGGWRGVASPERICDALDAAFEVSQNPAARKRMAERGVAFAQNYDWDRVVSEYWAPFLESIA